MEIIIPLAIVESWLASAPFEQTDDVSIVLGGQIENERETTRQIAVVSVIALLLVFSVLAGQFRRLRLVLVVLASVPVAIVGAIVSLLATGTPLNASSLISGSSATAGRCWRHLFRASSGSVIAIFSKNRRSE